MKDTDKQQVLASYRQQYDALFKQVEFATSLCEHYANLLARFQFPCDLENFFSLGYCDQVADLCRAYLKFFDLRKHANSDLTACVNEMDVIKEL